MKVSNLFWVCSNKLNCSGPKCAYFSVLLSLMPEDFT